ncbi:MAG: hypothetical protein JRF17_09375 [Deltaproteobacteria bacterium]|jgi:hypothetical protein|nr:hypothetical protein [Deltaproteobacteria bacterium]
MKKLMKKIFTDLNKAVEFENLQRLKQGTLTIPKSEVLLLGQMSLMLNESVVKILNLIQTGDMDAKLRMDYFTKNKLLDLLEANGLVYDEDSHLIWIPENAKVIELFKFKNIEVKLIDAESTLVSKAIHAPQKNKQLVRQAIASGKFPELVDRIIENNGKLDFILEDNFE